MEDTMATTGSLSPSSTISDLGLDLSGIPPVAVLSAHFKDGEEGKVKEMLRRFHAPYTADVARAKVFIGKVATKKRAEFELRARKIVVDEVVPRKRLASPVQNDDHASKKPRMSNAPIALDGADEDASATEDETVGDSSLNAAVSDGEVDNTGLDSPSAEVLSLFESPGHQDFVWVIRLDWLEDCVQAGHLLPLKDRLVYTGRVRSRPKSVNPKPGLPLPSNKPPAPPASQTLAAAARPRDHGGDILERAEADAVANPPKPQYQPQRTGPSHGSRRFEGKTYAPTQQPSKPSLPPATANLLQQTTSEYEGEDSDIPPPPDWVVRRVKYACQRYTPANSPNSSFLSLLQQIRTARTLIDDTIGVRAYSTIIASIAAYPYPLSHPREIASLPGCDEKTAVLFAEWKNTGRIQAVEDFLSDPAMQILRSFYDIWGVGAKTARQFYYTNGWRELDDIIEYGWAELDRVQQIGVKYYDDFLSPIPRSEVEAIASVVRAHAAALRDERVTATLVGGYRRGKEASGDVDVVVSHPELSATHGLVAELVASLEKEGWITHTLTLSLTNSHRGQQALPFRTSRAASGAGFDTLDKALVVWQDPVWPTRASDVAQNPSAKNPNIHRRVDIIVSPWRTLGCAVMGWSGGTTFQRDLRRYAKAAKGWKFDSSGIRDRGTGEEVLLEGEGDDGDEGDSATPEEKEMKVFAGLGLDYIPPHGRCTF